MLKIIILNILKHQPCTLPKVKMIQTHCNKDFPVSEHNVSFPLPSSSYQDTHSSCSEMTKAFVKITLFFLPNSASYLTLIKHWVYT